MEDQEIALLSSSESLDQPERDFDDVEEIEKLYDQDYDEEKDEESFKSFRGLEKLRFTWQQVKSDSAFPIFIEASSLFHLIFSSRDLSWVAGGQTVAAAYLAEKIIADLTNSEKRDVSIIGFRSIRFARNPSETLFAKIILEHLEMNAKVDFFDFNHVRDPEYLDFVEEKSPSLFVVNTNVSADSNEMLQTDILIYDLLSKHRNLISNQFSPEKSVIFGFSLSCGNSFIQFWRGFNPLSEQGSGEKDVAEVDNNDDNDDEEAEKFCDIESLTIHRLAKKTASESEKTIIKLFAVHSVIKEDLSLSQRSFLLLSKCQYIQEELDFIEKVLLPELLVSFQANVSQGPNIDLFDGRLIILLLELFSGKIITEADLELPEGTATRLSELWERSEVEFPLFPIVVAKQLVLPPKVEDLNDECNLESVKFATLKSPLVDDLFKDILKCFKTEEVKQGPEIKPKEEKEFLLNPILRQDSSKDHTVKDGKPKDARSIKWQQRQVSKYFSFLSKYGETLHRKGPNTRHVLYARSDNYGISDEKITISSSIGGGGGDKDNKKSGAGGKKKQNSTKQDIINSQKKKKLDKDISDINIFIKSSQSKENLDIRMSWFANELREKEKKDVCPEAIILAYLYLIDICMQKHEENILDNVKDLTPAIYAFRLCIDVAHRFTSFLNPNQFKHIQRCLFELGFRPVAIALLEWYVKVTNVASDDIEYLPPREARAKARAKAPPAKGKGASVPATIEYPKASEREEPDADLSIKLSPQRFQLSHCGHLMQRGFDSQSDPRVSGFQPDKWQREVLTTIDNMESAVIVAPTSAGKTFISYYAMRMIKKKNEVEKLASKKKIVVYIAPDKALMNQVAAEAYQIFGADVGQLEEKYNYSAMTSQILVTVPKIFSTLLLDPEFKKNIGYVIFDEIHCLQSDFNSGVFWNHCLSLIESPFIALSATIKNRDDIISYFSQVKNQYKSTVRLITHEFRYSDLKYQVYSPTKNLNTTVSSLKSECIHDLHPVTVTDNFDVDGPLKFIRFSPDECLTLYDEIEASLNKYVAENKVEEQEPFKTFLVKIKELRPETYFTRPCIIRADVFNWEDDLKGLLSQLASVQKDRKKPIIDSITGSLQNSHIPKDLSPFDRSNIVAAVMNLLAELNAKKQLPALVFCLDPALCEFLARGVNEILSQEEYAIRSDPTYVQKMRKNEKHLQLLLKMEKKTKDLDDKKKEKLLQQSAKKGELEDTPDINDFLSIDSADPNCTYAPPEDDLTLEEKDYWLKRIRNLSKERKALVTALKRGIGVHHEALPTSYRSAVEVMLRAGNLGVVFATETLALGINMPCVTTVFLQDSPSLDTMAFRQMSGRAGRRGFDDVGYVVFAGISNNRINSLIRSSLPKIIGYQPLNPEVVLTALWSLSFKWGSDMEKITNRVKGLLGTPLLRYTTDLGDKWSQYCNALAFWYFDYLYQSNLIDANLKPKGLAIPILALFQRSGFHINELMQLRMIESLHDPDLRSEKIGLKLIEVLASISELVPVPDLVAERVAKEQSLGNSRKSKIVMQTPEFLTSFLLKKNKEHIARFVACLVRIFPVMEETAQMPLSNTKFRACGHSEEIDEESLNSCLLFQQIQARNKEFKIRSPFFALSGSGDHFHSTSELKITIDSRIPFGVGDLPIVKSFSDYSGKEMKLNNYIADFYINSSPKTLAQENFIREATGFKYFMSFFTLVRTLKNFMPESSPLLSPLKFFEEDMKGKIEEGFNFKINF